MKYTSTPKTAMLRLAEALDWEVESRGRAWVVINLPTAEDLTYNAIELLCFMTRVAMASPGIGGKGLTGPEITELIRYRAKHIYNRDNGRYYLDIDGRIAGGDEITMYKAYYSSEGVS